MRISKKFIYSFLLFSVLFLNLSKAQSFGYFKFDINVDSVYLVIDKNYLDIKKIVTGDSIQLTTGFHNLEFYHPFSKKAETNLVVYKDSVRVIWFNFTNQELSRESISNNLAAMDHFDSNFMIITDDDSDIFFNEEYVGTGFATFNDYSSRQLITIQNPNYKLVVVNHEKEQGINLIETYLRPSKQRSIELCFFPGASQWYKGEYFKSAIFAIGTTASVYGLSNAYYKKTYKRMDYETYDSVQNVFTISAIILYGYNIVDAVFSVPKGGFQQTPKPFNFYISSISNELGVISMGNIRVSLD